MAEACVVQAGLRPNPELALNVENIRFRPGPETRTSTREAGSGFAIATAPLSLNLSPSIGVGREDTTGAQSGFAEAEFNIWVSQEIEVAGKRGKRVEAASLEQHTVSADYAVDRLRVLGDAVKAFEEVLHTQQSLALAQDFATLAGEVRTVFKARVEAGKVSPLELNRAELALAEAELAVASAQQELATARVALSSFWGSTSPAFAYAAGDWHEHDAIPSWDELSIQLEEHPRMQRWMAALESREAQLRLERARRIPNPTLAFGVRMEGQPQTVSRGYSWSTGDVGLNRSVSNPSRDFETTVMFEVSMPLPIFSRNQGSIEEAQYHVEQVGDARRAARVALERELRMAYTRLAAAHKALARLDAEVLPTAEETFALTEEGYRQGKFGYLDVLEAQRTLFSLRTERLNAAAAFHIASVDIERLTGLPVALLHAEDVESSMNEEEAQHAGQSE